MPKVSIVVPVYNVEKYLKNSIDSMINQTLKDIEIIIVDDGSPDNCGKICDKYSGKDKRIKVLHKKNAGVSAARNDGLKLATGEYVIFCDSDDWMPEDACEVLYNRAVESNADIVIGDVYMAYEDDTYKYVKFYKDPFVVNDRKAITNLIKADIYRSYCVNPPEDGPAFGYGGPWNKLVKRELLINKNVRFDLRVKGIFDDILYTAHILHYSDKICYVQAPVYNYRIVESSITHSYKPNVLEINAAIFNAWLEFFDETGEMHNFDKPFYACVMRRIEESIKLYFVNSKNPKKKSMLKREFKSLLQQEPYKAAIRNVDLSKISRKQKAIAVLGRYGLTSLIWKMYKS